MLRILKDFPANVLAIRAEQNITRKDYEDVLIPAAKDVFATHEKLRVYYEIAPGTGFDAGAMWEDFTFGVGHLLRWERVAVVTDETWMRNTVIAFGFFMPCPVKAFASGDARLAREWLLQKEKA